jgi:hypothetical protein
MGESIYSSVDSCNSTHTRVSLELRGGVMKTFLDGVILGEGVEGGGAVGGCGDGEGEWTCVTFPARLRAPEQLWMTGAWPGCRSRSEG